MEKDLSMAVGKVCELPSKVDGGVATRSRKLQASPSLSSADISSCSLAAALGSYSNDMVYLNAEDFTTGLTVLMPTRMVQENTEQTVLPPQLYRPLLAGVSITAETYSFLDRIVHETLDRQPTSAILLNVKGGYANDRSQIWKRYLQERQYPLQGQEAGGDVKNSLLANSVVRGLDGLKPWLDSNNFCFFCLHYAYVPGEPDAKAEGWRLAPVVGEEGTDCCDFSVSDIQVSAGHMKRCPSIY